MRRRMKVSVSRRQSDINVKRLTLHEEERVMHVGGHALLPPRYVCGVKVEGGGGRGPRSGRNVATRVKAEYDYKRCL